MISKNSNELDKAAQEELYEELKRRVEDKKEQTEELQSDLDLISMEIEEAEN